MSSDVTTGADDAAPATAGAGDLSKAPLRLPEHSFNGGNLELIDQLVASEPVNHDPSEWIRTTRPRGPYAIAQPRSRASPASRDPTGWLNRN
jgi:hypothetical protein